MELTQKNSTKVGGLLKVRRFLGELVWYPWLCIKMMTTFTILGVLGLIAAAVLVMGLLVVGILALFVGKQEKRVLDILKDEKAARKVKRKR